MLADGLEHLADEAFRRPVGEADAAAGAADAQHLGRRALLVRAEHHAEGREHGVERAVGEGQVLRVGLPELDDSPSASARSSAALEQARH